MLPNIDNTKSEGRGRTIARALPILCASRQPSPELSLLAGPIVRVEQSETDHPINSSNIRPVHSAPDQPCTFTDFLDALGNPSPALAGGPPQTIRAHVGSRQFGDFSTVLMAEKPASADLSAHVARWRATDRTRREDLPLHAHPDQVAEDRRFNFLFVAAPIAIMLWVLIGLMAAWLKGML